MTQATYFTASSPGKLYNRSFHFDPMIILHAAFCDASLFLWGESSGESKGVSKKRRNATPVAHFDLGASGLRDLASELGIGSTAAKSKRTAKSRASGVQEAVAW